MVGMDLSVYTHTLMHPLLLLIHKEVISAADLSYWHSSTVQEEVIHKAGREEGREPIPMMTVLFSHTAAAAAAMKPK